ncbi:hypothetical protein HN371_06975 [Candidatus Poribacteria bacterium]|jgi:hypothetical protein|nr:hypothetical protein [Candidatus Poribacteria bacterium]MBT5534288.1 hypothetical protein [Candidatus Poribacteria bacterium]MBT5709604.1 hypothetical protein [Candidatus Poribacteria bacterium]MBT7805156.1 hypothetical protein [Candidatus Poribacteria bacterium]
MPMTDEERFRFDLTGFLVRPSILASDEVAATSHESARVTAEADLRGAQSALPGHPLARHSDMANGPLPRPSKNSCVCARTHHWINGSRMPATAV